MPFWINFKYPIFSDLKSSLNRNLQEESPFRKGHFAITESTIDLELSSDAKSGSGEDDDSAIGEGITESNPISTVAGGAKKQAEPARAAFLLADERQPINNADPKQQIMRSSILGKSAGSLFVAPAKRQTVPDRRDEGFKAVTPQLMETHNSDASEPDVTSRSTKSDDEQKEKQKMEDLEKQRREKQKMEEDLEKQRREEVGLLK